MPALAEAAPELDLGLPTPQLMAPPTAVELATYDRIVVAFSGGKDSVACVLHLLEMGVPPAKIELRHHEVDGRESAALMDWPSTPAYCRAVASVLGIRYLASWKEGGFEREMTRNNTPTAPTHWESLGGHCSLPAASAEPA